MKIINITKNTIIAEKGTIADTSATRMKGLLGRKCLKSQEALVITKCQSIHMFFMQFAIDAIFVDKNNIVVGVVKNIKPWALSPIFFKASYVVETVIGTIVSSKTVAGDKLSLL